MTKSINQFRKEEITELAEALVSKFDKIPVDVELIALKYQIKFKYKFELKNWDGFLVYQSNTFFIFINLLNGFDKNSGRSRFTFAHELGHYFIDEHRVDLVNNSFSHASNSEFGSEYLIEKEADFFAASLLMPREYFINKASKKSFSPELIENLSEYFQTSITATLIRYIQLDLYPIFTAIVENGIIIRYDYSADWSYGFKKYYGEQVPELSAYYDFIKNGKVEVEEIDYDVWFSFRNKSEFIDEDVEEYSEPVLCEYCYRISDKKHMVLLWEK